MRVLEFVKLVGATSLLATAPVVSVIMIYAKVMQPATFSVEPGLGNRYLPALANGPSPLEGQNVITSDGERIGEVTAITSTKDGHVQQIHFKISGLLGFGQRTVSVPVGHIAVTWQNVVLDLNSIYVSSLPSSPPIVR